MASRPREPLSASWLLCDADGTLFPSEEPAFAASAGVVNDALAALGIDAAYGGDELRRVASGRSFRGLVTDLAAAAGRRFDGPDLDRWVDEEMRVVTEHLTDTLRPDPLVVDVLTRLRGRLALALVSSSALARLDACLQVTWLEALFPRDRRFSAQDSLPVPTSKPDPAVYEHAVAALGIDPGAALAVEDAEAGVRSAVAAGIAVVGITTFVPLVERADRAAALQAAGALTVVDGWEELASLVVPHHVPAEARG